jgi:hypothetical protein
MKTPRALVTEMFALERMIVETLYGPCRYVGWPAEILRAKCEKQLDLIQRQVKARRTDGVMSKSVIRGILGQVRLTSNFDSINWLQVELQNGVVAFEEEAFEWRQGQIAFLFIQFYRSHDPVTDQLVNELYWLMGSSFDDLRVKGEESNG